jgi:alcohol dehydrogenase
LVACGKVHGIEAYSSTEASPLTDRFALGALRLASQYLRRAYENGNDLEAREKMMYASVMAGMAFSNAGLGYSHALTHQLGGYYFTQTHGEFNAVLLPHVLEFNAPAIPEERLLEMAAAMGEIVDSRNKALKKMIDFILKLNAAIGIKNGLKKMGVEPEPLEGLAKNAFKDIVGLTNPRQGTIEDLLTSVSGSAIERFSQPGVLILRACP